MAGFSLPPGRAQARARADELLAEFDLTDAGKRLTKTYSGGMRRRLDLAASLIGRPDVVFLDEPTTGLDPAKRDDVWDMIRVLTGMGTTVLLTTQYLEEADALANEITVIDHGKIIAHDTPQGLKRQVGGQTLEVRPSNPADLDRVRPCWPRSAPANRSSRRPTSCRCRSPMTTPSRPSSASWPRRDLGLRALAPPAQPRRGLLLPHRYQADRGCRHRPATAPETQEGVLAR